MLALVAVAFLDRATDHISGSPVTYGVVAAVSAVDAFFPVVPGETAVIAIALAVAAAIEVVRRVQARRGDDLIA
jgi:ethanolamine utilization microcompartment shell protein EutS